MTSAAIIITLDYNDHPTISQKNRNTSTIPMMNYVFNTLGYSEIVVLADTPGYIPPTVNNVRNVVRTYTRHKKNVAVYLSCETVLKSPSTSLYPQNVDAVIVLSDGEIRDYEFRNDMKQFGNRGDVCRRIVFLDIQNANGVADEPHMHVIESPTTSARYAYFTGFEQLGSTSELPHSPETVDTVWVCPYRNSQWDVVPIIQYGHTRATPFAHALFDWAMYIGTGIYTGSRNWGQNSRTISQYNSGARGGYQYSWTDMVNTMIYYYNRMRGQVPKENLPDMEISLVTPTRIQCDTLARPSFPNMYNGVMLFLIRLRGIWNFFSR